MQRESLAEPVKKQETDATLGLEMGEVDFHQIPAVARRMALDELTTRVAALEAELAKEQANCVHLERQLASAIEELECLRNEASAVPTLSGDTEDVNARITQLQVENQSLRSSLAARQSSRSTEELKTCRNLADKCVFVVGFARSYTTITLEMLNCAPSALLLGEANFFLHDHGDNFSRWYNNQHREFGNQITKSSYAPDFVPDKPHTWWQWLEGASQFYDCIGEKIALSDYHFDEMNPDAFRVFYEARFLESRYIFMLRNPVDVLLSSAKLLSVVDDSGMTKLCAAWLDFMLLWADFVRIFPHTMTIVCEDFGEATVSELETFTGLELGNARLLISVANKRPHKLTSKFPILVRLKPQLEEIYAEAMAAIGENRALWQAEQKRDAVSNETDGTSLGSVAITPRPLGELWLRARDLRQTFGKSGEQADQ